MKEMSGEDYFRTWAALELGFDLPRKRGFSILVEDHVVAFGVDILRVDEEAVHIKKAGSNFGKAGILFNAAPM